MVDFLFVIISLVIGIIVVSVYTGGLKELKRVSKTGVLILSVIVPVLISMLLFGNFILGFGENYLFIFTAFLFSIVFISSLVILHRFHTEEGGEYPKDYIDEFTIRWIIRLKNARLTPISSFLFGITILLLALVLFIFNNYLFLPSEIVFIILFFILQPFGILFISLGYIWSRNKERVEGIIRQVNTKVKEK
ncbi:MAG: hypothetical protein QXN71_02915 [Candidatus Aenigmatarchaeota archaeon]